MGLWAQVTLTTTGAVTVRLPWFLPHLNGASGNKRSNVVFETPQRGRTTLHGTALSLWAHPVTAALISRPAKTKHTFYTDHYPPPCEWHDP